MRRATLALLAEPDTHAEFELDPTRERDGDVVEAFLVSTQTRAVWPVLAGSAYLPPDLAACFRAAGNVFRRIPMGDPRIARFVLRALGSGFERVPFEEVVGTYRDLAIDPPPGYEDEPHPDVGRWHALAAEAARGGPGARALHVGCGVGRGVFALASAFDLVVGLDPSVARIRRARNISVTTEHFFLPAPPGSAQKEVPLDLGRLVRDRADFAVGEPEHLPFAPGAFDFVLLELHGERGPRDPRRALAEAERVLAPGGRLAWRADPAGAYETRGPR